MTNPISVTEYIKLFFSPQKITPQLTQACALGTKLHSLIDKFLETQNIPPISSETLQVLSFFQDYKHLTLVNKEQRLYDETLLLSGRYDALFKDRGNNYYLCDWKRSAFIRETSQHYSHDPQLAHLPDCAYTKYALQLNLYCVLLKRVENITIKKMYLVQFHPKIDNYICQEIPRMRDEVQYLLQKRMSQNHLFISKTINTTNNENNKLEPYSPPVLMKRRRLKI